MNKNGMGGIQNVTQLLKRGGVGVMATDTIYGIVGSALSKKAVERIYKIRKRNPKKPMIVLIHSFKDLNTFHVKIPSEIRKKIKHFWPGKVSIILSCPSKKFEYLHRGKKSLAFRLPAKKSLRAILKSVGPLVAPSANIEGKPPANTISQAKKYFGDKVDFYLNGGRTSAAPSALIGFKGNKTIKLR